VATVLFRDDFTGSGTLAGRAPDGVDGGNWVNCNGIGDASAASVGSGVLPLSSTVHWDAKGVMTESVQDCYVEVRLRKTGTPASYGNGGNLRLTMRLNTAPFSTGWKTGGVEIWIYANSATEIETYLSDTYLPVGFLTDSGYATHTVADASDVVVRMELVGTSMALYLNGVLARTSEYTVPSDLAGGAGVYVANEYYQGNLEYIEAGSLAAPVTPPFWTDFIGSYERT
jgi:hypothetical protein